MTATNHAVTGAAIAVAVNQPWALPLALVAHFIEDAIPHFDMGKEHNKAARNFAFSDVFVGIVITILLTILLAGRTPVWLVLTCAFLCAAPDIVWGWRYWQRRDYAKVLAEPMSLFSRWHLRIQWSETRKGAVVEAVWLMLLLSYIISRR